MPRTKTIDTAIIGAGVGGAYAAWRLANSKSKRYKPTDIHLFEMSERIGGRLCSVHMPGMPKTVTELGGMRITSRQHIAHSLVEQLGLTPEPFGMGGDANLVYIRGKRFRVSEYGDANRVPFDLPPWERGQDPGSLMFAAMNKIVPGIGAMKTVAERREACENRKIDGVPLREYGFWSLLLEQLSGEGYNLALQGGGYNTLLSNWNCADAIPWYLTDFSEDANEIAYTTLKRGMDSIPKKLCTDFRKTGGKIHMHSELIAFNKSSSKGLLDIVVSDHKSGKVKHYLVKRLILALPKWAINKLGRHAPDRVAPTAFFRKKAVHDRLNSVTSRTLYKFALAYESPWWHMLDLYSGRSVTDLPLRQVYYFGTEGDQPGANKSNRNSYIDCSYTDGVSVGYWEGLRQTGPTFDGRPNPYIPKGEASYVPDHQVSNAMVDRASQQLAEVHGIPNLPKPYAAVFKNWADEPYSGGWHTWNIGVDSTRVMKEVRQPDPNYPVYICGETYSANQGWVEGALQTSERMLEEHFGLPRPSWFSAKCDLGP